MSFSIKMLDQLQILRSKRVMPDTVLAYRYHHSALTKVLRTERNVINPVGHSTLNSLWYPRERESMKYIYINNIYIILVYAYYSKLLVKIIIIIMIVFIT